MKVTSRRSIRTLMSAVMISCLLLSSVTVMAKKGEKNYKRGLAHEAVQQWELAMQEFAMALDANPTDAAYQLHYRRAVFNASQELMKQGQTLVQRKDFVAAHAAFRKAFGYDPMNELAHAEMDRMVKLQIQFLNNASAIDASGNVQPNSTIFQTGQGQSRNGTSGAPGQLKGQDPSRPLRDVDQKRNVIFSDDLKSLIRMLADPLELTIIFDSETFKTPRKVEIDYRNVTWAEALDNLFLQEGLFFQKVGRQTILVAHQNRRPFIQGMSVRTYFLKNSDPVEIAKVIQAMFPTPQGQGQGRLQTAVPTPNKSSNSISVRDTPENLRLIENVIRSLDKDHAEVMMDVKIYEVAKTDLMQFGNQIGTSTSLTNLGGIQTGLATLFGSTQVAQQALTSVPTALGAALLVPATSLSAFQNNTRTRLLYSTQVHAFDGVETTTLIGDSVPIQTANVFPTTTTITTDPNTGAITNGSGFPVIEYRDTGLTLKFTPQIFPDSENPEVQVKMTIESKDIVGDISLTPTFTQRSITGTARIPNNATTMMASISQNKSTETRSGLPLMGLIPVLGRLFVTPQTNNNLTDIVITVTPRVLRAPVVIEGDEEILDSGTSSAPPAPSVVALMRFEDEELLKKQLPDRPGFPTTPRDANFNPAVNNDVMFASDKTSDKRGAEPVNIPVANQSPAEDVKSSTSLISAPNMSVTEMKSLDSPKPANLPNKVGAEEMTVSLGISPAVDEMQVGEKKRLTVAFKSDVPMNLSVFTFLYDPQVISLRIVDGESRLGPDGSSALRITPSPNASGSLLVTVTGAENRSYKGAGGLLTLEVAALKTGASTIKIDPHMLQLLSADGRSLQANIIGANITVK